MLLGKECRARVDARRPPKACQASPTPSAVDDAAVDDQWGALAELGDSYGTAEREVCGSGWREC
jgi:hypothetical protein